MLSLIVLNHGTHTFSMCQNNLNGDNSGRKGHSSQPEHTQDKEPSSGTRVAQNSTHSGSYFYYTEKSTPYWDDSNGIIYDIPSSISLCISNKHARTTGGGRSVQQEQNSYADTVSGGVYRTERSTNLVPILPNSAVDTKRDIDSVRFMDLRPSFKPKDMRRDNGLQSPKKDIIGTDLDSKNRRGFLHRGFDGRFEKSATKHSVLRTEVMSLQTSMDRPKWPTRCENRPTFSVSSEIVKGRSTFQTICNNTLEQRNPFLATTETASPLELFRSKQESRCIKESRASLLDQVIRIRGEKQSKALRTHETGHSDHSSGYEDKRQIADKTHARATDLTRSKLTIKSSSTMQDAGSTSHISYASRVED